MGLLTEMSGGAKDYKHHIGSNEMRAKSVRESVIRTGGRLYDECEGEYETHATQLSHMFESDSEKDQYEAGLTMLMVKRTQDYLEAAAEELGEATITKSLNGLPRRVLDVVRIFYPNQIATELVDIQPLDGKVGEIFTMSPRFTDSFDNIVAGDEVFKTRPTNHNYASETIFENLGAGDGATTAFSGTLAGTTPIRAGTFQITTTIGGLPDIVADDGAGNLVGANLASGSINYITGAWVLSYSIAPDNLKTINAQFCYDSEQNENAIRSIEFDIGTTPVEAKCHPITFKYSVQGALAAKAHLNIDTNETLAELAAQYIKHERDEFLVKLIDANATAVPSLNFNASAPSGFSITAKYAEIENKLDEAESEIQDINGRGGVDWVLCGRNAANIMKKMRGFQASAPVAPIGSHVIGSVRDGTVSIVKSLTLDPNAMIFGYKGYMAGDSACILAEWIPVYFTPTFQNPRFMNEQGVMSMYDLFINNKNYYVKGTVSNYAA